MAKQEAIIGLVLTALCLLRCEATTSPDAIPDHVRAEWAIAQQRVEAHYDEPRARFIHPEQFGWRVKSDLFWCGDILANGCFSTPSGTITYNRHVPEVIRHEAGHAILWKLNHPDWRCWEHWNEERCQ